MPSFRINICKFCYRVGELTTDRYGEASIELPEGDFYLRELEAPAGYKLNTDRLTFRIKSGQTNEITIKNKAETPKTGTLLIIKESDDGKKLKGAVFGIYDADTNKKLDEITTERYGEAEIELDAGSFFLRELKAPDKYELSSDKISFKLKADETKEIAVTNKLIDPENPNVDDTGILLLIKKAESTGKRLQGAVFGVYDLSTGKLKMEITTNANGEATAELPAGEFYLLEHKAPSGYTLETTKIPFVIKVGKTVKVDVTNMLIKDTSVQEPSDPGTPGITIPKTGEAFPILNYTLAALMFVLAALCGFALWREQNKKDRSANLRLA